MEKYGRRRANGRGDGTGFGRQLFAFHRDHSTGRHIGHRRSTDRQPHFQRAERQVSNGRRPGAEDHRSQVHRGRLRHVLVADVRPDRRDLVVHSAEHQGVPFADDQRAGVRHPRQIHQEPVLLQQGRARSGIRRRRSRRVDSKPRDTEMEQVYTKSVSISSGLRACTYQHR